MSDRTSKIVACDFIPRGNADAAFTQSELDNGAFYVNLENYLLVPKEFLTSEELAAIWRKAAKAILP